MGWIHGDHEREGCSAPSFHQGPPQASVAWPPDGGCLDWGGDGTQYCPCTSGTTVGRAVVCGVGGRCRLQRCHLSAKLTQAGRKSVLPTRRTHPELRGGWGSCWVEEEELRVPCAHKAVQTCRARGRRKGGLGGTREEATQCVAGAEEGGSRAQDRQVSLRAGLRNLDITSQPTDSLGGRVCRGRVYLRVCRLSRRAGRPASRLSWSPRWMMRGCVCVLGLL